MSNDEICEIILKLKFRSRKDEWYVENTWAELESVIFYNEYKDDDVIEDGHGLFNGWTMKTYIGNTGLLPRWDGETCPFDEFDIFYTKDDVHTQVNKLTIKELKDLIG
jgi:hypothetical protein